jgi:hypothetical protein
MEISKYEMLCSLLEDLKFDVSKYLTARKRIPNKRSEVPDDTTAPRANSRFSSILVALI